MQDLPHRYRVQARGGSEGEVELAAGGLPGLRTAAPAEFGGPGDRWSPETLLVGAVADCFVLTFRAVARASKLAWSDLACDVEGVLEKDDGVTRFTKLRVRATLRVPEGTDEGRARRALEKAERGCLVTNSLIADSELASDVEVG
ncbi:MAG: OsmC family protein [Myxococcota bacterium]|nr:OsmC family protein [Myxococcota bacterium]